MSSVGYRPGYCTIARVCWGGLQQPANEALQPTAQLAGASWVPFAGFARSSGG